MDRTELMLKSREKDIKNQQDIQTQNQNYNDYTNFEQNGERNQRFFNDSQKPQWGNRNSENNHNQNQNVKNFSNQEPKPCWNFQAGNCAYGNNCRFGHNVVKIKKKVQFSGNDRNDRPTCSRCGYYSHQEENCKARTHKNGTALLNPSIDGISVNDSLGVYLQDNSDSEGEICTLGFLDFESDNSFIADHLKLNM